MFIALVGLLLTVLIAGHRLARKDEARLLVVRRRKMLELGWV